MRTRTPLIAISTILLLVGFIHSASTIIITSPGIKPGFKSTTWFVGGTKTIKWQKNGPSGPTCILMLYNGNNTIKYSDIVTNTENDGDYSWQIPANITPGYYVIRLATSTNVTANSIKFKLAKAELKKAPDLTMHKKKPADLIPSASANIGAVNTPSTFSISVKNIGEMPYDRVTCDWIKFYYWGPTGTSQPPSIYDMKTTYLPNPILGGKSYNHVVTYTFTQKGIYKYRVYVNPPECQVQTGPDPDSNLANNGLVEKTFEIK